MQKHRKKLFYDICADIVGALLISTGLFSFAEKINIAPGGVSGISIMIKYITGLPIGLTSLIINIPLLIIGYRVMGKRFALRTVRTVLVFSFILDAVATPFFPQYGGDRMLGSVFCGVCTGSGLGIVFLRGSSTGGTDILSHMIGKRFPHIEVGKALLLIDCVILTLSGFVFRNIESALFGVVAIFCQAVVIDKIVYGIEKGRNMLIISPKNEQIAKRILLEKERGATFLYGQGAYSKQGTNVLMCVARVWEYHRIKEIVYEEDPHAFVIAMEAEHVIGEGFTR